jgi:hypothetical protein
VHPEFAIGIGIHDRPGELDQLQILRRQFPARHIHARTVPLGNNPLLGWVVAAEHLLHVVDVDHNSARS